MYIGNQDTDAKFSFKNNHFKGTFRTMLANLNGRCIVEGNTFENKVFSVNLEPTAQEPRRPEATCITISVNDVKTYTDISIKDNIFNNSGAFYFPHAENVVVENNNFDFSSFQHYIQVGGRSTVNLDIRNNSFNLGNNKIVAVDTEKAIVRFPDNMKVLNYWAWSDTQVEKPVDYSSYVYCYNSDGSRTFYPESEAALKEFINPAPYNIAAGDDEKIVISENITIEKTELDIPERKNITIEVPFTVAFSFIVTSEFAPTIFTTGASTSVPTVDCLLAFTAPPKVTLEAALDPSTSIATSSPFDKSKLAF